jgi:hypothetical protein
MRSPLIARAAMACDRTGCVGGSTMRGAAGLRIALGIAAGLSACAAPPESIAPSYVSSISYDSLNCFDLLDEAERVDAALTQPSQVPVSTLSSTNVAPQVASLEGQQQAIDLALAQKHCRVTVDVKGVARAHSTPSHAD